MGRKKKPGRSQVGFWLPDRLITAGKAAAEARGKSFTDLMGELLADATGEPYNFQEELPLAESA